MTTRTAQRKPAQTDRHPADIVAALWKAGWSTRSLAAHHGYSRSMVAKAMHKPSPRGERLIAVAIGVRPEEIWPARYARRANRTSALGPKSAEVA